MCERIHRKKESPLCHEVWQCLQGVESDREDNLLQVLSYRARHETGVLEMEGRTDNEDGLCSNDFNTVILFLESSLNVLVSYTSVFS